MHVGIGIYIGTSKNISVFLIIINSLDLLTFLKVLPKLQTTYPTSVQGLTLHTSQIWVVQSAHTNY